MEQFTTVFKSKGLAQFYLLNMQCGMNILVTSRLLIISLFNPIFKVILFFKVLSPVLVFHSGSQRAFNHKALLWGGGVPISLI